MRKYRSALVYDMRGRFGIRPGELRGLPSSETVALVRGLTRDSSTHLYAEIGQQTFLGSQADLAMTLLAQLALNIVRSPGTRRVTVPGPYYGADKKKQPQVPAAERKRLRARLRKYSSIPD